MLTTVRHGESISQMIQLNCDLAGAVDSLQKHFYAIGLDDNCAISGTTVNENGKTTVKQLHIRLVFAFKC